MVIQANTPSSSPAKIRTFSGLYTKGFKVLFPRTFLMAVIKLAASVSGKTRKPGKTN